MDSSGIPLIKLEISFVELPVRHQNFNLAIDYPVPVEAPLNNLIRKGVEHTIPLRFVIPPVALIQSSCLAKLTDTISGTLTILKLPFVDISVGINQLSLAILKTFGHLALIHGILNSRKLISDFLHKVVPVSRDTR